MTNHGSKLGMGKRLDNSNSQHHGRIMFATKFVLIYRRPLGEHQDKTPASNLFPPHSIKTVTRTASV